MQENHIEQLDKMFPNGYVIIYTCPDNQIRCNIWNPHKSKEMFEYWDLLTKRE